MRPFFSFYGGKWRDTPRLYPAPLHPVIVEPFAGSAGYSLRYFDRNIILRDIDPVIVAVWRYLIGVLPAEILQIPDIREGQTVDDLEICQEARWLVGFWLNKGASRPRKSPSAWMRSGIRPGSFWGDRVRTMIARQVPNIRHWQIVEASCESAPDIEATWFVDPPYQEAGKHYAFGSAGINYAALGDWCRSRKGQVIACEQSGADWLDFRPLASTKTARKTKRSAEVIWTGGCE